MNIIKHYLHKPTMLGVGGILMPLGDYIECQAVATLSCGDCYVVGESYCVTNYIECDISDINLGPILTFNGEKLSSVIPDLSHCQSL